eukprot:TRINITY_DN987_c0_g1_i2.p1 TRINITY_DN987_c0_g1~~TRINITY_DN987_c0_g1_i2.p1  ORF type:complete len:229 (-),score=64.49 TRINITY_DN987_c0_g1_i2:409-1095(-)
MAMPSKPKFAYWKIRGLAQPARLLLNYAGVDFEDVQYEQGDAPGFSTAAWQDEKYKLGLAFPNLPYYIDGKIKITQSNAILRYIARKHNLLGETDEEKANVDMMLENAMDFRNAVVRMAYSPDYAKLIKVYEQGEEKGKDSQLTAFLKSYDNWMVGKKFFAGDKVTVADFPMYELLDQHKLMVPGCLKAYKNLTAFVERFESLPKIKAYMASDKFMKRPINNKSASFK